MKTACVGRVSRGGPPGDESSYLLDVDNAAVARRITTAAFDDADAVMSASRRHDQQLLDDINAKLVSLYPSTTSTPTDDDHVIVRPQSTVEYTSAASVSTVDSGLTNLIHDRCSSDVEWSRVFQVFISYTGGQSVSHVLLWQPSECVHLIVNSVIVFPENKYDDDDDVCSLFTLSSVHAWLDVPTQA